METNWIETLAPHLNDKHIEFNATRMNWIYLIIYINFRHQIKLNWLQLSRAMNECDSAFMIDAKNALKSSRLTQCIRKYEFWMYNTHTHTPLLYYPLKMHWTLRYFSLQLPQYLSLISKPKWSISQKHIHKYTKYTEFGDRFLIVIDLKCGCFWDLNEVPTLLCLQNI